jgi:preprotein translocase subunit SecG
LPVLEWKDATVHRSFIVVIVVVLITIIIVVVLINSSLGGLRNVEQ